MVLVFCIIEAINDEEFLNESKINNIVSQENIVKHKLILNFV